MPKPLLRVKIDGFKGKPKVRKMAEKVMARALESRIFSSPAQQDIAAILDAEKRGVDLKTYLGKWD